MSAKGTPPSDGGESGGAGAQVKGPQPSPQLQASSRGMQQLQAQVEGVTEIMRDNIEKVHERDALLTQLDQKAEAMCEGAEMFVKQGDELKSKFGSAKGTPPSDGGESGGAGAQIKGPQPSPQLQASSRGMQQLQAQVEGVTEIMRDNIEKVHERDALLTQLDEKAEALCEGAEMFVKQGDELKSKFG